MSSDKELFIKAISSAPPISEWQSYADFIKERHISDEPIITASQITATEAIATQRAMRQYIETSLSIAPRDRYLKYTDDSFIDASTYSNEYIKDQDLDEAGQRIADEIDRDILRRIEEKAAKVKFEFGDLKFDDPRFEEVDDVPDKEDKEFIFDPKELDI